MQPWWTDQQAGMIGGIAGSAVGILGGLIGTIAGIAAPRGRLKRLVLGTMFTMVVAGATALAVGLYALAIHQPYAVWYPLVLIGGISVLVFAALIPTLRARYRQAELRRLDAEQFRRS